MSRILVAVIAAALLAGCGGTAKKPAAAPSASPTSRSGTFAPEALLDFRCRHDHGWVADGVLRNAGKQDASYQVTVYIGDAGSSGTGTTKRFEHIGAGDSLVFTIENIAGQSEDGTCNVQVLQVQ